MIKCIQKTHLDALVVQVQAECNPTPKDLADLGAIRVLLAATLHPALLMHNAALNDTVPNRLAHDILRVLLRVQVKLDTNIPQRDARVRERQAADARLDHVLAQAQDERVRAVLLELRRVAREHGLELRERARAHRLHDVEVRGQGPREHRVPEEPAVGDVAHEQLDDDEGLVHGLEEARRGLGRGRAPDGLLQVRVRVGVVELHGLDAPEVVVVPRELRVARGRGEGGLGDELVGLVVEVVGDVAAQEAVDEGGLRFIIVPQRRGALCGEE